MSNKINKKSLSKTKINEKKAITIIIILFIVIVFLGGYISFRFKDKYNNSYQTNTNKQTFTYSTELVTLTKDNIMSNENGLKSNSRIIRIYNNTNEDIKYKIILKEDDINCTCTEQIPKYLIKYSLDGKIEKSLNEDNQILLNDKINKLSTKKIEVRLWIDESFKGDEDHYHGRFIIEKIED